MRRIVLFFLLILLIIKIPVLIVGCANIVPPMGGPRDSLPPLLVKVTPPDSSTGFNTKTITFTFDEFIDRPQDLFRNLIISPTPSIFPSVENKLRTLTVRIKDTLEPNTTYYYNFGDAIKDVNEGNVLRNFSYIFTTGNTLDTLQLGGKVILAETGGIDSTLFVMLHRSGEDSAVLKDRPRYITKLDGQGNFLFRYLPTGTYYIYALKDESGTRRYSDKALFAFADSSVEVKPDASPVTLYAFIENQASPAMATINFAGTRGTGTRPDDRRLRFTSNLSGNTQDLLNDLNLNFETPLRNIDTTKLQLSTDSAFIYAPASWQIDSLQKKLTLKTNWKENTLYNLILDKDFAEDSAGRKLLKTDTLHFTTKKQADYGSLKVTFVNLDLSQNPVLQLSQNGQVVKTFPLNSNEIYQSLFTPGEYDLSILFDKNKNGKWDPGQFFGSRRQPELVRPLNKKITIRANWDNEFEIRL
ncbi:MAG TPA: Ig-like domain-containing protein [Chitinophagaceae bacterium]|nr:Ig-like domain-containing protein [Chitinophagaceae bacterium]